MYTNNSNMDNMDDTATTLMRNDELNNIGTEMGQDEINNNASQKIGYIGSSGSFCSRNTDSEGTIVIVEEEQSITGHNSDNTVNVMDYTFRNTPRKIRTTTKSNDGFTAIQNGSPNRNSIRGRRESRVS
jgi:ribosomal protein S6E (S10)